jgi:membrane fusion protein (multidrug efflux system)
MRERFPLRRLLTIAAALLLLIVGAAVGVPYYRYYQTHVSTDDAYVDGSASSVSPRISGTVIAVDVASNWLVKRGQVLIRLDPRDYEVRLEEAQAELERARQTVDSLYAQYASAESAVDLARAQLRQARLDFERADKLHHAGVVSQEYYDQSDTAYRSAVANLALAEHGLEQSRAALGSDASDHDRYDRAIVHQAEAAVQAAKLALAYSEIVAPVDGIVENKHVELGDRVQPGEPLMLLVPPPSRLYVTANFKETQLGHVRVGQPVEIRADAYPGYVYRGHVDSIGMGTGAAFALLPPENATGNWVKVVQRVPVKILLNQPPPPLRPLRIGLSVEVAVDTHNSRGQLLASELQESDALHGQYPEKALPVPPLPDP